MAVESVSGERILRFETSGPTPTDVLLWLRDQPPTSLGGHDVTHVEPIPDDRAQAIAGVLIHLEHAQVRVDLRPAELALTLSGHHLIKANTEPFIDKTRAHHQLVTILAALGSLVADPERSKTTSANGPSPSDTTIERRADALFDQVPTLLSRNQALRLTIECIDLTTLAGDDTAGRIRALCAQARQPDPTNTAVGPTAAVCVYPNLVRTAVELVKGSSVAVASVAGAFPSGLSSLEVKLDDIADAVAAGADEIDVVLNRAAFLSGHHELVRTELRAMRESVGERHMKVILETSELETPAAIRTASHLAIEAGADWIKTSTGKSGIGATPMAVLAMAEAIAAHVKGGGKPVGLKISGGVRSSTDALGYLSIVEAALGIDWFSSRRVRFGASGLLNAVVNDLAGC